MKKLTPGKLILCGEYAVVFGYPGIALPLSIGITVTFEPTDGSGDIEITWTGIEKDSDWTQYLKHIIVECQKVSERRGGKLTIQNQLPLGKGLGSSTSLLIGVARALLGDDCRSEALVIEDTLNPGHSGIDFSVIWANAPVQFSKDEGAKEIDLDTSFLKHALLIDTGQPEQQTPELVAWMKERKDEPAVAEALKTIGECSGVTDISKHHQAQVALGVVPEAVQNLIADIEALGGSAKVLGAGARTGGGGMVLAVAPDENTKKKITAATEFDTLTL